MSDQSEDVVGLLLSSVSCIDPLLLHALLLGEACQRSADGIVSVRVAGLLVLLVPTRCPGRR